MDTASTFETRELADLVSLSARVFSDYRDPSRGSFAIAYLMSETSDNEQSVFLRAVELARSGQTQAIGICEGDTTNGYDGFDHSVECLKAVGYPEHVPIHRICTDPVNTLTEVQALVAHMAGSRGDIAIVAPPFHIVRSFMTAVTIAQQRRTKLHIYAVPGVPIPWNVKARHSQGTLTNMRTGLLGDELTRLKRYQASEYGSLMTPEAILRYLDWRDT